MPDNFELQVREWIAQQAQAAYALRPVVGNVAKIDVGMHNRHVPRFSLHFDSGHVLYLPPCRSDGPPPDSRKLAERLAKQIAEIG